MPSWIRYDLDARYSIRIAGGSVAFRANLQNLLNQNDWLASSENAYISPGSARALRLPAQPDF